MITRYEIQINTKIRAYNDDKQFRHCKGLIYKTLEGYLNFNI